jgi:hypothetical protein
MKKIMISFATILFITCVFAQSPQKMSYQAVIRNASNNLVTSTEVAMQFSVLSGSASGTAVYVETQTPTTNANGLVNIELGSGTVVSGNLSTINWAKGPYFIKTEIDPNGAIGGVSYTITNTSQLLSVPYAFYAQTAGNGFSGNYNDLNNKPMQIDSLSLLKDVDISNAKYGDVLFFNGTKWLPINKNSLDVAITLWWDSTESKEKFGTINLETGERTLIGYVGDLKYLTANNNMIIGKYLYVVGSNSSNVYKIYKCDLTTGALAGETIVSLSIYNSIYLK